jgi:hypothetical protein
MYCQNAHFSKYFDWESQWRIRSGHFEEDIVKRIWEVDSVFHYKKKLENIKIL